ncbi:MAG: SIS domain-containing protein, partial [Candidatus Bathyarchaeota archaeon]
YLEAMERGCMTVSFTSGGLLQEFSKELGVPLVRLPAGYPPRSAIAYLFFPLVISLERLNLINPRNELNEVVEVVKKLRDEIRAETPLHLNSSKKLAVGLEGSIPFICGFDFYESIAIRLKTQFNENSKTPAKAESFPELNHNETVGWTGLKALTKNFSIILIRDSREETEIKTRIDVTRRLVFDRGAKNVLEIQTRGTSKLARMFSAMYIGDFASIYLALLYGIDPTPVAVIDELKRELGSKVNKSIELKEKLESVKAG